MIKIKYFTIKEFAEKAKVSTQAIYQRLDKDLKSYLQVTDGKKMLSEEALSLFDVKDNTSDNEIIKALLKQLEAKDEQLKEKDSQLASKDVQIKELIVSLINEQNNLKISQEIYYNETQPNLIEPPKEKPHYGKVFFKWFFNSKH